MRLLLDTHIFLWYITADPRLPPVVRSAIQDPANEVHLSAASVWEIVIKHGLGKLALPSTPAQYVPQQRAAHQIESLTIEEAAVAQLAALPPLHRDPFDRIIIAQALHHGMTLVSLDSHVRAYPVPLLPEPRDSPLVTISESDLAGGKQAPAKAGEITA